MPAKCLRQADEGAPAVADIVHNEAVRAMKVIGKNLKMSELSGRYIPAFPTGDDFRDLQCSR